MKKLLAFLWSGCWHKWVEDERTNISRDGSRVIGRRSYCHCERCGARRYFNMVPWL